MNVAIVGCGLIGQKRSQALGAHRLTHAVDPQIDKARQLAATRPGARASGTWTDAIADPATDIVIVATTNDVLADITLQAVRADKHVLVEKPAARRASELEPVIAEAATRQRKVKVGFNHRYHPAIRKAKEVLDSGAFGPIMFLRAVYGHGGRVGYDKEWRARKDIAGGGELLDQGLHLVDLSRWFLGPLTSVDGFAHTYFWDMAVDDNGFMMLKTASSKVAWLHVSCTEWKNCFGMEIYAKTGKLHITGLGGSYGLERLACYQMLPEMGPPETTIYEYPFPDQSWRLEFEDFVHAIETGADVMSGLEETRDALAVVDEIYRRSGL